MIVAAGLTPAWQQILRFEQLRWGEVNRAAVALWCASGKVLNVGLALQRLQAEALVVCPLGGAGGEAIRREFASSGIAAEWIPVSRPTRVCTTLLDSATGTTTELVEYAAPLSDAERAAFHLAFNRCRRDARVIVLTGSLPAETPASFYADLLGGTRCPAVLDIRGPELLAVLDAATDDRCLLVKPNREELGHTLGHPIDSDAQLRAAIGQLLDRGAAWVLVTQGKQPAWLASRDGCWTLHPPAIAAVVNPIGCGDCLAAGIAAGWQRGLDTCAAVCLGMAAAAANAGQILPARFDGLAVEALAATIRPVSHPL